jgi:glycosyltransferase involved in cell wall biosynthesis
MSAIFEKRKHSSRQVVFIPCPTGPDDYAGWLYQMRKISSRIGHEMTFEFLFGKSRLVKANIWPRLYFDGLYAVSCCKKILGDSRVCMTLFPQFYFANNLVAFSLWILGVPYAVRISGGELDRGNFIAYRLRIFLMRRARAIIVLNRDAVDKATQLSITSNRLHYIPNPVSTDFRPPSTEERLRARDFVGVKNGLTGIGVVGTLCPRKRQLDVVYALKHLNRKDVVLVLCGPSEGHPEADPEYKKHCMLEAEAAGVSCIYINFVDDVKRVLWGLDIFVMASEREGMPNALLEAMACGLSCVGADIPGVSDIIEDQYNGFLYPCGDVASLSKQLESLISIPTKSRHVGVRATSSAKQNFSSFVMDQKYMALLTRHK